MRASDGPGKSCSRALQLVLRSTSGALAKFLGLNQLRDEGRYLKGMAPPHSAISATVPGQIGRGLRQCVYTRVSETLGPKREVIYSWQGRVGIMIALALSCPRSRQRLGGVRWKMKGGGWTMENERWMVENERRMVEKGNKEKEKEREI